MSNLALALILTAAFIHATWNLLNKRASGHATFTWIVAALSACFYLPVAVAAIVYWQAQVGLVAIVFMVGSAVLHTAYFVLLNEGYRAGDLSLVYPLARATGPRRAVIYALVTGAFIAAYTLWDKQAVSKYAVAQVLLDWGANLGRTFLLTPFALRHWEHARNEWHIHRFEAVGVALLVPLSYILVLTAMEFTPVSYVAPAR